MRTPLLLLGDAPGQATGMSRIATDLAASLWASEEDLGIRLLHVGQLHQFEALPKSGLPLDMSVPWKTWGYTSSDDFGDTQLQEAIRWTWPGGVGQGGVILAVQDPARSFSLLKPLANPDRWQRWGYFSVDGVNRNGTIGGPAARAIQGFDRVLGYAQYGADVLGKIHQAPVDWIPHGLDTQVWHARLTPEEYQWASATLNPTGSTQQILGCVSTNQPRKDLWAYFEVLRQLIDVGVNVRGWLHIDREIGPAWSVPQLAADTGITWKHLSVTTHMTDRQLACCYALCAATFATGRGEGFGYPILESLACGAPAVHVGHAAGAELIELAHLIEVGHWQAGGPYGILRPSVDLAAAVGVTRTALEAGAHGPYRAALARETHEKFDRQTLWASRWLPWLRAGLTQLRGEQA